MTLSGQLWSSRLWEVSRQEAISDSRELEELWRGGRRSGILRQGAGITFQQTGSEGGSGNQGREPLTH